MFTLVLSTGSSKGLFCLGNVWKVYINARGRAKAVWRWRGLFAQVIALTLLQGKSCSAREEMLSREQHIQRGLRSRCWCGHANSENAARPCNYPTRIYRWSCRRRGALLELLPADLGSARSGFWKTEAVPAVFVAICSSRGCLQSSGPPPGSCLRHWHGSQCLLSLWQLLPTQLGYRDALEQS